jgi:iron complex transport system substrate-binding protein
VRARPHIVMSLKAGVAEMPKRPGWQTIPALRAGRWCAFPSATYELIVHPGPRMGEAARAIADCLVALGGSRGK